MTRTGTTTVRTTTRHGALRGAARNRAVLVDVSGDAAVCRAHVIARHHLADAGGRGELLTSPASWCLTLARIEGRWSIDGVTVVRQLPPEGDPGLHGRAAARA